MAKKDLLDAIDVPAPCAKSWEAMHGGDKARFCANCEKDVHNISEMTRGEVKKLLFQSKESVCIRMEKDADGRIKTLKRQFHQITRRVPIAAGVLSASLTLSAVADAQKRNQLPKPQVGKAEISQSVEETKSAASISGIVSDAQGAVIPNAKIILHDTKSKKISRTVSNVEGFYEFKNVAPSVYEIKIEAANGFQKNRRKNVKINGDKNLDLPIVLEPESVEVIVGVFAEIPEIIKPTEAKTSDKVQTRQIESLPVPGKNKMILGLFKSVPPKSPSVTIARNQNTSRISFTIYDPNNEVIPNGKVELTNQETKEVFTALTDQFGVASFDSIPHGRYDLLVSGNGFSDHRQIVRIKERIEPNVKISLDVGFLTGVVVVDWSEIPLFRAIAQDDNETVKQFINSDFPVNTKDESGETALHIAVQHGNIKIVRFLLGKGAKVSVKDKSKRTPLAMVFDSFEDDEKINREIIRLLVSKGADVDVKDEDTQTLLMRAAEDDDLESVKLLLELGANPNVKDDEGETAADKTDSSEIKQLLRTKMSRRSNSAGRRFR